MLRVQTVGAYQEDQEFGGKASHQPCLRLQPSVRTGLQLLGQLVEGWVHGLETLLNRERDLCHLK